MRVSSAVELVNNLSYKPGWTITATDHSNRFEATIVVQVDYPARNSDQELAPKYPEKIMTYAKTPMVIGDCDDVSLYRQILNFLMEIELHEAREFLRVRPTFWAPFNPHRLDGMRRYDPSNVMADLRFGIA